MLNFVEKIMFVYSFFIMFFFMFITSQGTTTVDGPALYKITEPLLHGECPTWDNRTNTLYFVDIPVGKIYSYNYDTKNITSIILDGLVAPVVQSKSDPQLLIVGLNRSVVAVKWDQEKGTYVTKHLVTVADESSDSNMNDGKADKEGRIWFGTMGTHGDVGSPNEGALYRITNNTSLPKAVISPVNISNGMAWNKANDKFYYIDSPTLQIYEYNYDNVNGEITNRSILFDLKDHNLDAHPDGMTIDEDDNLWVALYGGGSVIKVNSTSGELLDRIPIPAECVTSVMWGGPNLDILFVTTSRKSLSTAGIMKQPGAGCVYALTNLGTRGRPVFEADIINTI